MEIKTTYKGILNGVSGLWCGFKPEGLEVLEERQILYPDEGKELQDKDGNVFSSVWLKDDKTEEEDFTEVKAEENRVERETIYKCY
jgi:hypothetical protein